MRKSIVFIASILSIALTVNAQSKKSPTDSFYFSSIPTSVFNINNMKKYVVNVDTIHLTNKVKVVVIDSVNINTDVLRDFIAQSKANKIPLFVSLDWVITNWQFIKKAASFGYTDEQMDNLKEPLIQWVQYIQNLQSQQKK